MNLLNQRPAHLPKGRAMQVLGLSRAQVYPDQRRNRRRGTGQSRALSHTEREQALATLHSERFCDQPPRQVYAALLSEGEIIASPSTLYRLLRAQGENRERRAQRPAQHHAVPRLVARAPHEVWTWDITKLPTLVTGVFLNLYLILDLYSRHVVGWMVSRKENAGLAQHLFRHALTRHGIAPGTLVVHQDRGAPMTAHGFRDLLQELGAQASYSRPRVSNDNPFSESHFKTLKYSPNWPGRFDNAEHARTWLREFFEHYHQRGHHGMAMYSPTDVLRGQTDAVWRTRQDTLDANYAAHPERYVNGPPQAAKPPSEVCINPLDGIPETAADLLARQGAFKPQLPEVEDTLPEVVT